MKRDVLAEGRDVGDAQARAVQQQTVEAFKKANSAYCGSARRGMANPLRSTLAASTSINPPTEENHGKLSVT